MIKRTTEKVAGALNMISLAFQTNLLKWKKKEPNKNTKHAKYIEYERIQLSYVKPKQSNNSFIFVVVALLLFFSIPSFIQTDAKVWKKNSIPRFIVPVAINFLVISICMYVFQSKSE